MKKRLDYIDRAKGILIILMVIGHIWQKGYLFDFIYAFHMPGFFIISGMLMCHTRSCEKNYLTFAKSRVLAYGMPFVMIELLGCLTDIVRHGGPTLNWKGYLFNTLTLQFNDGNLWFLLDLCLMELLFTALYKGIKNEKAIFGVSVVLFAVRYLLPADVLYVSTVVSVCKYFVFFAVGYCFSALLTKQNAIAAGICGAYVLAYAAFGGMLSGVVKDIAYVCSGICGTYAVLQLARLDLGEAVNKVLKFAGSNTLIIYGTHHFYYVAVATAMGIRDFTSTPIGAGLLLLAAVTILELPTITIINRWLPFLAGKRRRKERNAHEHQR